MPHLRSLLKADSLSGSLGLYVPATIAQKTIGLGRVLLLAYLMRNTLAQYGLWNVGVMIFVLAGDLMNMGVKHSLARYVSYYESRGQLVAFYRRMRWYCLGITTLCAAAVACVAGPITRYAIASREGVADVPWTEQMTVCWMALANAVAMALFHSMLAFMTGLRTYRLVSLLELLLAVLFTALATATVLTTPTAPAVLGAHLAAVTVVLVGGMWALNIAVNKTARDGGDAGEDHDQADAAVLIGGAFGRVMRFALATMAAGLLWRAVQYVSFYLTNRNYGKDEAGVFSLILQLSLPVMLIASAAWTVVFTHVAKRWESSDHAGAMRILETSYKAIAMATMTLTLVIYATSGLWGQLPAVQYRPGVKLLGGLLTMMQTITQVSIVSMVARLREKPIIIAVVAVAAMAVNVLLAQWWMGRWGVVGIAWAGGVGVYVGAVSVAIVYLLVSRTGLGAGTYLVLATPILLAAPIWAAVAAWAVVLGAGAGTNVMFSPAEKRLLLEKLKHLSLKFHAESSE